MGMNLLRILTLVLKYRILATRVCQGSVIHSEADVVGEGLSSQFNRNGDGVKGKFQTGPGYCNYKFCEFLGCSLG